MDLKKTSKFISLILRHKPETIGISLDEHGWANVAELIEGISKTQYIDMAMLEEIVDTDNKHRNTWNGLNPVTRTVPNGKGYDRNKQKQEDRRSGRISYQENIYRIFLPCLQNNVPVARFLLFRVSTFMIYCTQYLV